MEKSNNNRKSSSEWQSPEEQEACERAAAEAHVDALNQAWRAQHLKRRQAIEKQLLTARTDVTAVDRVLVSLAAHDAALAELLGDAQVLVASRVLALVNNPKQMLALARGLRETTSCRTAATTRVEQLLLTVARLPAKRVSTASKPLKPEQHVRLRVDVADRVAATRRGPGGTEGVTLMPTTPEPLDREQHRAASGADTDCDAARAVGRDVATIQDG
jgi:hypothetical protein